MEYYNNVFCISKPDLTEGDPLSTDTRKRPIINDSALHIYIHRNVHVRMRKGGGPGCPVLINYDLLRSDLKQKVVEKYGDVKQYAKRNLLAEMIEPDYKASSYFSEFLFDDGSGIKTERQVEYNSNATILNAIGKFITNTISKHKALGNRTTRIWENVSEAVNTLDHAKYPHTLPSNPLRLKEKFKNYQNHGYFHLIHKGNKNDNAKKLTANVEKLIISIYCMENLPFSSWVHDNYLKFISGTLTIIDKETGSIYDREDFFDEKHGSYITISRGTVWNVINNPANAIIIDRLRNNRIDHVTKNTPYSHRKSPKHSLGKISMDDRTLSRKTTDGKWLNAYLAFDVCSDAILSCVYSTESPDLNMVWECFREMYRNINKHNLMWPGEVEVENHLMKDIEDELQRMFSYVTFCAPGLSRSKRAEHKIRSKKYGDEKMYQTGIGRWSGKGAYKTKSENKDEDYKQPRLPVEQLIDEDRLSIERFNHDLHPNQKLYPGKTRWQVLTENIHPDLGRPMKYKLCRYLGMMTKTSIRNNDIAQVQYEDYQLDNQAAIERLRPSIYEIQAYYVPELNGNIPEVFFYQGDVFIGKATKIERYQEAKIERTEDDERIRTDQAKRQSHFFKVERDGITEKVTRKLEIFKPESFDNVPEDIVVPEIVIAPEDIDEIIQKYSGNWGGERALESI